MHGYAFLVLLLSRHEPHRSKYHPEDQGGYRLAYRLRWRLAPKLLLLAI